MSSLDSLRSSALDMNSHTVEGKVAWPQTRLFIAISLATGCSATVQHTLSRLRLDMWCLSVQLMDSKAAELERLLSQLSDVNDGMRNALGGRNDTRAHTLTRHRDILHDYQQVIHAEVLLCLLACVVPTQFSQTNHWPSATSRAWQLNKPITQTFRGRLVGV